MDERRLIEKLLAIESLFAGAATEGERVAADRARRRILERLEEFAQQEPPVEYRFTLADMWSRKVFVALLRRYGIQPYRYSGQRYTTVMAMIPARFVEETLWPQFEEYSETLQTYLSDVTDRVVSQVIHQDCSEAEVVSKPKQLADGIAGASFAANRSVEEKASLPSTSGGQRGRGKGDRSAKKRRKRKKGKRR